MPEFSPPRIGPIQIRAVAAGDRIDYPAVEPGSNPVSHVGLYIVSPTLDGDPTRPVAVNRTGAAGFFEFEPNGHRYHVRAFDIDMCPCDAPNEVQGSPADLNIPPLRHGHPIRVADPDRPNGYLA